MFQRANVSKTAEMKPTLGLDDTVVVIYTYVTISALCQLINIFGIGTNIVNIACFVKQGFKDTVNISLLGLSISDLCSLITMVWTCISYTPAVIASNLPFDSSEVSYLVSAMPHFAFTRVSSCITAMITLERCVSVVSPLKVKVMFTPTRTAGAIVCIFITFTLSGTPTYVVNNLGTKFSYHRNRSLVGLIFRKDREHVEKITFLINNFLIPFAAFFIVSSCTIIMSIQLIKQSKWRKATINHTQANKISNRNQSVVKMVVTIATLFIVCFVPISIGMLAFAFVPSLAVNGAYHYVSYIIGGFSYILEGINTSMNIFIYHHMSSKYRQAFLQLFMRENKHDS